MKYTYTLVGHQKPLLAAVWTGHVTPLDTLSKTVLRDRLTAGGR